MNNNMSGLITGLSQGLSAYLGKQQDQQRTQQNEQYKTNLETQQMNDTNKFKTSLEDVLTPEMAEKALPGSGAQLVTQYNQQHPDNPLKLKEGVDYLDTAIKTLNPKQDKSMIRHYMGNSPDGDAIFSDNEGNMFGPDKQPYAGTVLPKSSNMPTAQARSTAEFATTIRPHIENMRGLIAEADKKGYIGPAAGRVYGQFLAGKVGSTGDPEADQLLGKLRAMDSLLKTGAMKVHFGSRGGANMYEHFSDMLNSGKQSAAMLNGSLDTIDEFMQGYAEAGQPKGAKKEAPKAEGNDIEAKRAALRAKLLGN